MKTFIISIGELATTAGVNSRTIFRQESDLGLTRIPGRGRQVVYQFTGKEEDLVRQIKSPYRRGGVMRLSPVPDPEFIRETISSIHGTQPEPVTAGGLLTLAMLGKMSLILGRDAAIQINAARHQRLVGSRHHKTILHILMASDLIEKCAGYKVGECCNSYRLTDTSMARLGEHQIWWPAVSQRQERPTTIEELIHDAKCPHNPGVLSRLKEDSRALSFPDDLDMDAIAADQAENGIKKARQKCQNLSSLTVEAIIRHAKEVCKAAHNRYLADPLSSFRIGEKGQRLYHPIAMMPRHLRARLRWLGEMVTTLDIRCCQPFLLGLLLWNNGDSPIPAAEFEDYMGLTVGGSFYEELGNRITPPVSREEAKRLCYRDLIFGKQKKHTPDIVKAFTARFPAMGRALTLLRRTSDSLASELQRSEARLIIGRVLPVLQSAFPNHPITIVHDAILLPHSIAAKAKALMAKTVEEATSRRPGIKAE